MDVLIRFQPLTDTALDALGWQYQSEAELWDGKHPQTFEQFVNSKGYQTADGGDMYGRGKRKKSSNKSSR